MIVRLAVALFLYLQVKAALFRMPIVYGISGVSDARAASKKLPNTHLLTYLADRLVKIASIHVYRGLEEIVSVRSVLWTTMTIGKRRATWAACKGKAAKAAPQWTNFINVWV